jgi:hypothetical protein
LIAPLLISHERTERDEVTRHLVTLASAGLPAMLDDERGLFCMRLRSSGTGLVREGISHRYTIMTLLGLHELVKLGEPQPFDMEAIFSALTSSTDWITNIGDLGLLTWLVASVFPHHLGRFSSLLNPKFALGRYSNGNQATMELAWFLTGCAQLTLVGEGNRSHTAAVARIAFEKLVENQGASGAFGHGCSKNSLAGLVRGNVGSFADQVYPIIAFSHMAKAYGMDEPLARAAACADVICNAQGKLGQWWWHYDSKTGKVLSRYPVYSVHQHAMGPMALFALAGVSGRDYSEPIYRGLSWISRSNELGIDLKDETAQLVWRCIRPASNFLMRVEDLAGLSGLQAIPIGPRNLTTLHECRPYELGWLLYAFAGRDGKKIDLQ